MYLTTSNFEKDDKFGNTLNNYVASSIRSKNGMEKKKLLEFISRAELPLLNMKNLYDDSNFEFKIDDIEKPYLKKIELINKQNLSIEDNFQKLEELNTSIEESNNLNERNSANIKSAISTAGYSHALWQSARKEIMLSPHDKDIDKAWGSVAGADVGGAVGAAAYAWGMNFFVGPGTVAYGSTIVAGALISSASALFAEWFYSVPVNDDPNRVLNTNVQDLKLSLELDSDKFDKILKTYNNSSDFKNGLSEEVSRTEKIINQ